MSIFPPAFLNLLKATTNHPEALPPIELHGFLTGIAIGPEETKEDPTLMTAFGFSSLEPLADYDELIELIWDATDEIVEDLIDSSYRVMLHKTETGKDKFTLWMRGFNKAVTLNKTRWEALNDEHIETAKRYAYLQSLANPELAETFFGVSPDEYATYQAHALPLVSEALIALYHGYWLDTPPAYPDMTTQDLPSFSHKVLARQTDDELFKTILTYADLLPRNVVDEAIHRGHPMAERLRRHLEKSANWSEDAPEGHWWALIHAINILGFINGDDATRGLLHAIRRMDDIDNNDLLDWIAGYWPALFRNKRDAASQGLQAIAFDLNHGWRSRVTALECLLEAAHAQGPAALDEMLQRIARSVEDASEDWDYRIAASTLLLNFPRDDHRSILDILADQQTRKDGIPHYDTCDVEDAYQLGADRFDWDRCSDPLEFYDPKNILTRQSIWNEDDEELSFEDPHFEDADAPPYPYDQPTPNPCVRETCKVGRDDPCPCGSGKKYKICCLKKLH